jgi:flagellar biosynthesis protein FlgN
MPTLAEIIATEADVVSAFVLLLKEEQEALKLGHAELLPEIVARKAATVGKLAPISAARNAALAQAQLAADRAGIEAWLEKNPADKAVSLHWENLQSLAAEARELNRLNGELIRLRMHHNAEILECLLAKSNRQDLYSADGQTAPAAARRIIDSA